MMSTDEVIRALAYALMVASFAYIGVRVWNAAVMPDMLRRPVAVLLWLQAAIYSLIMIGLLLLRLAHPVPALVWLNTALITTQAVVCVGVIVQVFRHQAERMIAVLLAVLMMVRGGGV